MSMQLFEMRAERASELKAAEDILARAEGEKRPLSASEQGVIDAHLERVKVLSPKIEQIESRNTIFSAFGNNPIALLDAGKARPIDPKAQPGTEPPDMARFHAEFHDFINMALGSPRPRMTADTDTPLYIGTGSGGESIGFTVPKEVLPYLPAYYNLDSFGLAGARMIYTDNVIPLVLPIISAGPAAEVYGEGAAPSDSQPFAADSFTLNGNKYGALVKASYEALMNSALPLPGAIQDELLARLATSLTAAITTAMLTALTGNSSVLVAEGTNDVYHTLGALLHAVPPRFDLPGNCWMLARTTLAKIKDQRASTSGVPMFDPISGDIFGKKTVINDNLSGGQVVYGSFENGAVIRRTPVVTRVFYEKYAEQGELGFRVLQWSDQHFICELSDVPNQPLFYSVLS